MNRDLWPLRLSDTDANWAKDQKRLSAVNPAAGDLSGGEDVSVGGRQTPFRQSPSMNALGLWVWATSRSFHGSFQTRFIKINQPVTDQIQPKKVALATGLWGFWRTHPKQSHFLSNSVFQLLNGQTSDLLRGFFNLPEPARRDPHTWIVVSCAFCGQMVRSHDAKVLLVVGGSLRDPWSAHPWSHVSELHTVACHFCLILSGNFVTLSVLLGLKLTLVIVFIAPLTALHLRHFHVRLFFSRKSSDLQEKSTFLEQKSTLHFSLKMLKKKTKKLLHEV